MNAKGGQILVLGIVVLAEAAGCGPGGTATTRPVARDVRGQAPPMFRGSMLTRVVAVNARTRAIAGTATVDANGRFTIASLPVRSVYRLHAIYGRQSVPITFQTNRNGMAGQRLNVFVVGTRNSRVGPLDGPIDVASLTEDPSSGSLSIPMSNAPDMQEDYDEDGTPCGMDSDMDGDGMPNASDHDADNDGMDDYAQNGDMDSDGITNESDSDVDGDGTPNATDDDNDNDGTPDAMDSSPDGTTSTPSTDSDGDGLPNAEDDTPNGEDTPAGGM